MFESGPRLPSALRLPEAGEAGGVLREAPDEQRPLREAWGKALAGAAHPNFKHGRDSKYLLTRLQENYEANIRDATLLTLDSEIAMIRAMAQELMDTGESLVQWRDAQRSWKRFARA